MGGSDRSSQAAPQGVRASRAGSEAVVGGRVAGQERLGEGGRVGGVVMREGVRDRLDQNGGMVYNMVAGRPGPIGASSRRREWA